MCVHFQKILKGLLQQGLQGWSYRAAAADLIVLIIILVIIIVIAHVLIIVILIVLILILLIGLPSIPAHCVGDQLAPEGRPEGRATSPQRALCRAAVTALCPVIIGRSVGMLKRASNFQPGGSR